MKHELFPTHWRRPVFLAAVVLIVATADSSAGLLSKSLAGVLRSVRETARVQAASHPDGIADGGSPASSPQKDDDNVKLRHRSDVINPYHVQFRDVTKEAGIHFH